jgi:hypothetical protein
MSDSPMTDELGFAKELADALGPLYRVAILSPDGEVEDTFGGFDSERIRRRIVPLPGSDRRLAIDIDAGAVEAAAQIVRGLGPRDGQDGPPPLGTFTHVDRALDELIAMAEGQVGRPISEMSRADKQRVVRFLDQRGAFTLRKAVETVADALGVSRFTVYNYLDASRED